MPAAIYQFFEPGYCIPVTVDSILIKSHRNLTYKCKICFEKNLKDEKGEDVTVLAERT